MTRRRFTVDEVNDALPEVTKRWAAALELRAQVRRHHERLEAAGQIVGDTPPAGASPEVKRDHLVLLAMRDALRDELTAIGATGCVVRDLDTGLCDWLGEHAGRDVWLCWRVGEPECAWWHDLEAGFAGRRPISELTVPPPQLPAPGRARR